MKTFKSIPLLLISSALVFAGISSLKSTNNTIIKAEQTLKTLKLDADELPIVDDVSEVTAYGNSSCTSKSEVVGLSGFSGKVLEVINTSDVGVTLDFRSKRIPTKDIVSMNIRYYVTAGRAFRITKEAGAKSPYWEVNNSITSADYNVWKDLTLLADGTGFSNSCTFSDLSDNNGNLTVFNIASRQGVKFYIDEIEIKYNDETIETDEFIFDANEIPLNESVSGVAAYLNTSNTIIDAKDAPSGATNKVMKLDGVSGGVGTIFDFKEKFYIPNVVSMKIRFYTDSTNEARITTCAGQGSKGWITRYSLSTLSNQWVELLLDQKGTNFYTDMSFSDFADSEGYFKPFNFMMRGGTVLYVDSVIFNVKKTEHVPPVIHTNVTEITTHVGVRPQLNVKATDDVDGEVKVTYKWSDGALDSRGRLLQGTHACILSAKDSSNNKSTHQITFTVNY